MFRVRVSFGIGLVFLSGVAACAGAQTASTCAANCPEAGTSAPGADRSVAATPASPDTRGGALTREQQDRPGVAVFPLEFGGSMAEKTEGLERLSIGIQQLLLNHFLQNPSVRIVERLRIKEILDEQGLAQAGRVDAQTAARIGKIVGARYMVLGSYMELPDMEVTARIVDTETSEIIYSRRVSGKRDRLMGLVADLGGQIEQGMRGLPPLPAAVREARRSQEALPAEVGFLYSQALAASDNGLKDIAIDLYQQLTRKFPQFTPAREALRQLRGS